MYLKKLLAITSFLLFTSFLFAQNWQPKKAPLMTRFAKDVNPNNVLPEYPRPQMVRSKWQNLNGLWQYQPGTSENETLPEGKLSGTILVPFPVESALSGVMEHHERLWYKRSFTIPKEWNGERILLHFGAVDFESEVFINGKSVGVHKGGYDPFSYDITDYLTRNGTQQIAVRVYDPTDKGGFPRGKQSLHPGGIMYTPTTGIWQTVWMEPVPSTRIDDIKIVPDIDQSVLKLNVNTDNTEDANVVVKIMDGEKIIATKSGNANEEIIIPVPKEKLWSPQNPFLYNLSVSLKKGNKTLDEVSSYFGMRKISVENDNGYKKMFLNNKFVFELGPLDQGFWPDGIYTAPTDEAIKNDLEMMKKLGFNMVRKHIKVEPYRWYYWADKLGLMVWQDMPSANSYTEHTPLVDTAEYASELKRMVETHWNSPCIIMWDLFNEGQGQNNTVELVNMVKKLDPSRLVNQASGGGYFDAGDVLDIHSYPAPACPSSTTQALACGEYGGIGYAIKNHTWSKGWGYLMIQNQREYDSLYNQFANDLTVFKTNNGLSAAVYTQITDVETELNGLMTYDRAVVKGILAKIRQSNLDVIYKKLYLHTILPTSEKEARNWKYTFEKPDNGNWHSKMFDDASWKTGEAGFGTKETPGAVVRTVWNTDDIWIRQEFSLGDLSKIDRDKLVLYLHHDDDCEVYINGVKAVVAKDYTSGYTMTQIRKAAKDALIANGKNVIAIHCHQKQGGQYIDAGISLISDRNRENNN
ncbi:MAG TPA: sugar-binding domain-containing protein [Hanamia sp.]